jgi:hypothetical protein
MGRRQEIPAWVVVPMIGLAMWVVIDRCLGSWPLDVHLRDDAYYYFCWARSLANGDGPCVTPGVATSGIHILWASLLTAVSFVCGSACLPAASVFLGLGLHLATGGLLYRVARPRRSLGITVASAYIGSPFLATEAMNGQETALACFALALFLSVQHRGPKAFLWGGVFAVLARSDLILIVVAMALVEPRARAPRLVLTGLVFAIYAGVNFVIAGSWLQDSAAPIPWLIEQEFDVVAGMRMDVIGNHAIAVLTGSPFRLASTPMAVAWLLAAWLGLRRRDSRFAWLLSGAVSIVCVHYFWRCYPRDYYFAPFGVAAALATLRLCQWTPRTGVVLLLLAVGWNGYRYVRYLMPTRNWQREMTMAGRFVNTFVPAEEPIGCFNAGIVTWHREGVVVNLDGVVNRPAFAALRRGALLAYLREKGVRFLLDNPAQFAREGTHANGRHFGAGFRADRDLKESARFTWPGDRTSRGREGMSFFSLYRIVRTGEEPFLFDYTIDPILDLGDVPGGRCVTWGGQGLVLRSDDGVVMRADPDADGVANVVQVPWDGRFPLRLYTGQTTGQTTGRLPDAGKDPVLVVAPK